MKGMAVLLLLASILRSHSIRNASAISFTIGCGSFSCGMHKTYEVDVRFENINGNYRRQHHYYWLYTYNIMAINNLYLESKHLIWVLSRAQGLRLSRVLFVHLLCNITRPASCTATENGGTG